MKSIDSHIYKIKVLVVVYVIILSLDIDEFVFELIKLILF